MSSNVSKEQIIKEFQSHEQDTGSPMVQIALLTDRIKYLSDHLKVHKKDHSAKRGLLILIAQRNSMLKYLASRDAATYAAICSKLSIRAKIH